MKWVMFTGKAIVAGIVSAVIWNLILGAFFNIPLAYHHDPSLGWMPKPYSRQYSTDEGRALCLYNEFGFRGETIGARQPREWRIVAIGDSFTEAHQVDNAQTFVSRLQNLLRPKARAGTRVRVLNAGRDNTTPAYFVHSAARYKQIFQPDWVVILIHDGNWLKIADPEREIYYRRAGDGFAIEQHWLWETMSPRRKLWAQWPGRDQPFFATLANRLKQMRATGPKNDAPSTAGAGAAPSAGPASPVLDAATMQRAVSWTVEQLKAKYPKLVLVHMPDGSTERNNLVPPTPTEQWLGEACRLYQVPLIAMRERIKRDYARSGKPPLGFSNTAPWQGHPNAHGHELIAAALAEFFAPKLPQTELAQP